MINQLSYLFLELKKFVEPLNKYLSSRDGMEYLCYKYGWDIPLEEAVFTKIDQSLQIKTLLLEFFEEASVLEEKMESSGRKLPDPTEMMPFINASQKMIKAIADLKPDELNTLPEPFKQADFWAEVAKHLLDDLLENYLRIYQSKAYLFFHLFGIIRYDDIDIDAPFRIPYKKTLVDWNQAVEFAKSPMNAFRQTYHWGDDAQDFEHERLFSALNKILHAIPVAARLSVPDAQRVAAITSSKFSVLKDEHALRALFLYKLSPIDLNVYEIGVEATAAKKAGEEKASGVVLAPIIRGGAGKNISISSDFNLNITSSGDVGTMLSSAVFPDDIMWGDGVATVNTSLEFATKNGTPWYILGNANTTRIEINGFAVKLSMEGPADDPEIKIHFKTGSNGTTAGCKLVIPLDESDSFVKQSVDRSSIDLSFGAEIVWSSKTGLRFMGESNLDVQLPGRIQIGPITLQNARLTLGAGKKKTSNSSLALGVGAEVQGKLGPIEFIVQQLGFVCNAIPYSNEDLKQLPAGETPLIGNLDLQLGFKPPKGIGIIINAKSVTGGGYLEFDSDKGEYIGIAQLNVKNKINVKAFGIILTKLPDGRPGYSFLLLISAEFPPIQLGLGFTLSGVGGLVGIHRGIDIQKVKEGIYRNDIDDVLFPKDPMGNVYGLIDTINRFFPVQSNQYTFGLMAQLNWGPKSIIRIELGLIIEFPEPVRLGIIGVLKSEVKKKFAGRELNVLQLQVNFAGFIDFDKQFIRFDAALYESKLLGMKLEGDMALRIRYGSNPDFAVTIGGFHPKFQPPALDLPANMRRLQIVLRSGNPSITVKCYLAVTSNTIQFGVAGEFVFKKWGVGIRGELSFDALFQLNPFRFITDVHFLLAASWKGYDFASIEVNGTFEGPSPWSIKGKLKLKVWIFSKTVHLDETWGDDDETRIEGVRVLPLLAEDLRNASNWEHAVGRTHISVTLKKQTAAPDAEMMLHPNEVLSVRQSTVPLGLSIDKFAGRKPQGANQFSLTLKNQSNKDIQGGITKNHFASAQFVEMTEEQQLHAPSYELFDSGLSFEGLDDVVFDSFTIEAVTYETSFVDDPNMIPQPKAKSPEIIKNFEHALLNSTLANSVFGSMPVPKPASLKTIEEQFIVVDLTEQKDTGTGVVSSETQARQILKQLKEKDTYNKLQLAVMPLSEII